MLHLTRVDFHGRLLLILGISIIKSTFVVQLPEKRISLFRVLLLFAFAVSRVLQCKRIRSKKQSLAAFCVSFGLYHHQRFVRVSD